MNIPDNKYLGKLCPLSHDWNNTGKSLRCKGRCCIECKKLFRKSYANNPKRKRYEQKYNTSLRRSVDRKKLRDNLGDSYVKELLTYGTALKSSDITPQLIELKRIQLKIERRLKNGN